MTIQPIGNHSVALYLTGEELRQYGVSPATLTLEEAQSIMKAQDEAPAKPKTRRRATKK